MEATVCTSGTRKEGKNKCWRQLRSCWVAWAVDSYCFGIALGTQVTMHTQGQTRNSSRVNEQDQVVGI